MARHSGETLRERLPPPSRHGQVPQSDAAFRTGVRPVYRVAPFPALGTVVSRPAPDLQFVGKRKRDPTLLGPPDLTW